jgi:DNA-binding response OmpR family regulator
MGGALRILVVDDDVDNAASLGELFEMEGHEVSVVHSGEDAIRAYVSGSYDLAFMDVMMPGKNGVESFLEIRRLKPAARVFMMTGYSVEELLKQAVKEGALGVLEKPFDAEEVLRLTDSIGPNGMLLAPKQTPGADVGIAIAATLVDHGKPCRLLRDPVRDMRSVRPDDVLVIDSGRPLIEDVSLYSELKGRGHAAASILVPPAARTGGSLGTMLRDIGVTGILNKPFDPLELLSRLSGLAA